MLIEITYNVTDVFVSTTQTPIYVSVSFEQPSSGGGAVWGDITGTLSNQTDLQTALDAKFDDPTGTTSQYLRGDGTLATFPAIPSGTVTSVGLTMPTAFSVANSPITSSGTLAVTGAGTSAQYIAGDGSLATFPSLTGYVPYTGATANVDLGTHRITAQNATIASSGSGDTVTLNHSSGSGVGLNITKGGNGEGLYINKTGGSGNAATIIGTINATTLVKSGGTSSQFLKADGSVDSSTYVGGSGASGQVSYWTGTSAQSGSNNLFWDATKNNLGIGSNSINTAWKLGVAGNIALSGSIITFSSDLSTGNTPSYLQQNSTSFDITTFGSRVLNLNIATNTVARFFTTGNLLLQNGGTFTDGGQRLQVQGTTLLNGNVTFSSATGMFWDATNSRLGIGTNAPAVDFDLQKTVNNVLYARVKNLSNGTSAFAGFVVGNDVGNVAFQVVGSGNTLPTVTANQARFRTDVAISNGFNFATGTTAPIIFSPNDTERMRIFGSTGNVGINTGASDFGQRLQVQGTTLLNGNVTFSSSTGMTWDATNSRLGIGTSTPTKTLVLSKSFGADDGIIISDTGGGYFQITNSSSSVFQPIFQGQGRGNASSLIFKGLQTATASPTATVTRFISRAGDDSSAVSGVNSFTFENGSSTILALTQSNNLILQNGGTFTDSGERLQVTGTSKFAGNMTLDLAQNSSTTFNVKNLTSGTLSQVEIACTSSNGAIILGKTSATRTAYKTLLANDGYIYNSTLSGDISILNDYSAGNIKFAAGGASTAHMTIKSNGRINMSSLPTSSTGLATGDLWNDAGTIKIV